VTGTIYFLAGGILHRDVRLETKGNVMIPAACSIGSCSTVESALKDSGIEATCTGTSSCTCAVSLTESSTDATTFAQSGNTVTTADGDTYEICVDGSKLTYKGKSAGAEDGSWELQKR
jgi:hypothetical protein